MTFSYSNALRSVMDALEKGIPGVEMDVAALPGVPGGIGGRLCSLVVSSGSSTLRPEREQEAAWKFIKWLMEPEQQAEWFASTGYLPISHSAIDQPAAKDVVARYPQFQVPLDLYLNSPTTPAALNALHWAHLAGRAKPSTRGQRQCSPALRTPTRPSRTPPRRPTRSSKSTTRE